jgi:hypothetical protein
MLASFSTKTFAAWTFRLVFGLAGAMPPSWVRQPRELYVRVAGMELVVTKQITEMVVLP